MNTTGWMSASRYKQLMDSVVEADRLSRPVCRTHFGPPGEPGDTNYMRYVESNPPHIPCGWDERDAKV